MYSKELINSVKKMRKNGKKLREISCTKKIPISSVQWILRNCRRTVKCKTGTKPHITKFCGLRIRRYISTSNEKRMKVTCRSIINETRITVSRKTLNNFLLRQDYKFKKQAQHIQLSANDKAKRFDTICSWIENNIDFKNAFFGDEKKFNMDGPDNWYI